MGKITETKHDKTKKKKKKKKEIVRPTKAQTSLPCVSAQSDQSLRCAL